MGHEERSFASNKVNILYFIPEDGDQEKYPKFYTLSSNENIKLGQIKDSFPLPGNYHFRFKKSFKNTYVWLDVINDSDVIPKYEGHIVAKVSRLMETGDPLAPTGKPKAKAPLKAPIDSRPSGSSNKLTQKKSSDDLLGLNKVPTVEGTKPYGFSVQSSQSNVIDLDWMSGTTASLQTHNDLSKQKTQTPNRSLTPPALKPSARPLGKLNNNNGNIQPTSNQAYTRMNKPVEVPNDLSEAAKDFTL